MDFVMNQVGGCRSMGKRYSRVKSVETWVYIMKNKENGAVIRSTEKYLLQWISRGFEVAGIEKK